VYQLHNFYSQKIGTHFLRNPKYGIWALILGTLKITFIATIVAVPIGLGAALYLSEYASRATF
jgi:phosphate transport system permease protein